MIVVHCSGSRCNHRYTLEQLRHDHVVVNGWRDIGYHFTSPRKVWFIPAVRWSGWVLMPWATMLIPSVSATRAVCRRAVAFLIPARQPRRRRWSFSSSVFTVSFRPSRPFWVTAICRACRKPVPASMPRSFSLCWLHSISWNSPNLYVLAGWGI